jgi:hypothetical protein
MAHTTFRGPNEPAWKDSGNKQSGPQADSMHGEGKSQAREFGGKGSEPAQSEEAARQKHTRQDARQHPSFNNAKPTTRG